MNCERRAFQKPTLLRSLFLIFNIFAIEPFVAGKHVSIKISPYYVQLTKIGGGHCGAAIISDYWLISVAKCFRGAGISEVRTGGTSLKTGGETHKIDKIILQNNDTYNINNLCLIKLTEYIKFNEHQYPIPVTTKQPNFNDIVDTTGFGNRKRYHGSASILKTEHVQVAKQKSCTRWYGTLSSNETFCTGTNRPSHCIIDSGGPGIIDGKLAGVVTKGCISSNLFIRVDKYHDWIVKHTGIKY